MKISNRIISLIMALMISMLVMLFTCSAITLASEVPNEPDTENTDGTVEEGDGTEEAEEDEDTVSEEDKSLFANVNEAIAGMIRSLAFSIFKLVQGGVQAANDGNIVTIDDLVFDKYPGTNINFFDSSQQGSFSGSMKENISLWYGKFRRIAITWYAIMVLYVGIRIMLSVGGREQEKYKETMMSWIQGLALLFLFPYGLKMAITVNSAFVQMIEQETKGKLGIVSVPLTGDFEGVKNPKDGEDNEKLAAKLSSNPLRSSSNNYMAVQANRAEQNSESVADAIVLLIMIFQFLLLLIAYYKRLFMTGFLITIFPIVMIMYPIDKMNDGKAQSFSVWSKELFTGIFTQTFHAIAYVFVIGVATAGSSSNDWLLSIIGITFLFKAEDIIKSLLGVGGTMTSTSPTTSLARAALTVGAVKTLANQASKTAGLVSEGVKDLKDAHNQGYTNPFAITAKQRERQEARIAQRHEILAQYEPGNRTVAPLEPTISLSQSNLEGDTNMEAADDAAEIIADAANQEVIGLDSNRATEDALTQKASFVLDNTKNGLLAAALEEHGLTTNGKGSLKMLDGAAQELQYKAAGLDKSSKTYHEEIAKINKEFTAKVRVALPNLDEAGVQKFSQALMKTTLATGGGAERVATATGFAYKSKSLLDPRETSEDFKAEDRKINGERAVIDYSTLSRRKSNNEIIFAQLEDRSDGGNPALYGYARKENQNAMDALNGSKAFDGMSQTQKEKVARAIAVTRTFGATSKLSKEEMIENLNALGGQKGTIQKQIEVKNKDGSVSTQSRLMFRGSEDAMQLFTANELQESTELIAKVNANTNGGLDALFTDEKSEIYMGASSEDILKISDEAILQFGKESSTADIIADSSGIMGEIKDKEALLQSVNAKLIAAKTAAANRQDLARKGKTIIKKITRKDIEDRDVEVNFEYTLASITGAVGIDDAILMNREAMKQMENATDSEKTVTYDDPIALDELEGLQQIEQRLNKPTAVSSGTIVQKDASKEKKPKYRFSTMAEGAISPIGYTTDKGKERPSLADIDPTNPKGGNVSSGDVNPIVEERSKRPISGAAATKNHLAHDVTVRQVSLEERIKNQYVSNVLKERKQKIEENIAEAIKASEPVIERMDQAKVDGLTKDEYIRDTKAKQREGARKIAQAMGNIGATAASAVTIGPMAIGLDTGENAFNEWVGGTMLGAAAIGMATKTKKKKIQVRDDLGNIQTVEIDPLSFERIAALQARGKNISDGLSLAESKVYDIFDLRQMIISQDALLNIEDQLNENYKKQEAKLNNDIVKRESEIKAGKTNRLFSDELSKYKRKR